MSVLWIFVFWVICDVSLTSASGSSKCKLDLGLVVDTTKSIQRENVPFLKNSLKQLIQNLDVSENGTHVSFETFAEESILHNKFNNASFHSAEAMEVLIEKSLDKLTMPTRLDYAIFTADEEMFIEESGDRPGVRNVMVLYTDGKSHPDTENFMAAVRSLKEKGVRIVVVAIGKFAIVTRYQKVLRKIAGENIIYVKDYPTLQSVTDDIQAIICPPSPCENSAGLDVAFLVDRTRSLGRRNYRLLKGFLLEVVNALAIGPHTTHTAFILFARNAKVLNTFNNTEYYSNEAVHNLIGDLSNWLGSRTFIDRALEEANDTLFTDQGGDRPTFPNVLILLTDGKTNVESKDYEDIIPDLKKKKVRIAAVGIGRKVLKEELKRIAGDNVYLANSFSDLPDLFSAILNETCSADGGFTRWSFWSECSVTCGSQGVQTRTRTCTNPPPQGYGKDCVGNRLESRSCNGGPCPHVDMNGDKLPSLKRNKFGFKWMEV